MTKNRESVILFLLFQKKEEMYMSIEEMNREELLEYKNTLFWKKNEILYQLQTKDREIIEEKVNYREKLLKAILEIEQRIEQYYNNKMTRIRLGSKKSNHERLKLLSKIALMYELYIYLFTNNLDEYLFDPKTYTFQDQDRTIIKQNYDLELYEELENKIPGVMDTYFDVKVAYCKILPELRKRKAELVKNPITTEDEIHMTQKLNLIEMQISSIEQVLKTQETELKL